VITSLRAGLHRPKEAELERLFKKLPELDDRTREEIRQFADRLVNKLLHPPLESLRDASQNGTHHGLMDALRRLFKIED
jgi:glutamyl-tRNA reductase